MLIRLGLFDDHDIVRAGFRHVLAEHSDIEIVAEGRTGREALDAIRHTDLHLCVIDLSMPDLSGMGVLEQLKRDPRTRHIPVHVISVEDRVEAAMLARQHLKG